MQEITVTIKWNEPDEPFWLNADNIKMALSTYCQNTTFEVEASRDSRILSAVPSKEEIESFRKLSREKMLDRCGTLTEKERYQLGNWFDSGFETANNFIKRGIAG